jgi:hypothetical protein
MNTHASSLKNTNTSQDSERRKGTNVYTKIFLVCHANYAQEGGLPCSVFSAYQLAMEECRRLAVKNMKQARDLWKVLHEKEEIRSPPDFFLKATANGIYVCRRFKGKHNLDFVVGNDVFYVKSFELDKSAQREWW